MHQRVSITLPEETLQLINRVTQKGDRSRFIDQAVRHYVKERLAGPTSGGGSRRGPSPGRSVTSV